MASFLDDVWQSAIGGLDWLKQVIFGEFDDHRSTSAVIADMLLSFVPGVIIVTSARDLTAVIIRLARHPDHREKLEEWMILIACVIPLMILILAAAAGAVVAGVGSVIGGGSEAGAALRAVCLLLIEESGKMLEPLVKFLRRFLKGDVLAVLRDIKFAKYGQDLAHYTVEFIGKPRVVIQKVAAELSRYRGFSAVETVLKELNDLERAFYAVQTSALRKIPLALAKLDARLTKALAEKMKPLEHPAHPTFPAPKPKPILPEPAKVPTMSENPLGIPEGTTPPEDFAPATAEKTNLHPQSKGEPAVGSPTKLTAERRLETIARNKSRYNLRPDLNEKWFDENGNLLWPPNDGAEGSWETTTLTKTQIIDRYGKLDGQFFAPDGASVSDRSIASDPNLVSHYSFKVTKDFDIPSSQVAPWFGNAGSAQQYKLDNGAQDLIGKGYLEVVPDDPH